MISSSRSVDSAEGGTPAFRLLGAWCTSVATVIVVSVSTALYLGQQQNNQQLSGRLAQQTNMILGGNRE